VCLADGISRRPFGLFFFLVSFPFCFVSSLFHFVLLVITYKPRGFFLFCFVCLFVWRGSGPGFVGLAAGNDVSGEQRRRELGR